MRVSITIWDVDTHEFQLLKKNVIQWKMCMNMGIDASPAVGIRCRAQMTDTVDGNDNGATVFK